MAASAPRFATAAAASVLSKNGNPYNLEFPLTGYEAFTRRSHDAYAPGGCKRLVGCGIGLTKLSLDPSSLRMIALKHPEGEKERSQRQMDMLRTFARYHKDRLEADGAEEELTLKNLPLLTWHSLEDEILY